MGRESECQTVTCLRLARGSNSVRAWVDDHLNNRELAVFPSRGDFFFYRGGSLADFAVGAKGFCHLRDVGIREVDAVVTTIGPGTTNMTTGVTNAWMDREPYQGTEV